MNSLETLKRMRDDFENTKHWLTEEFHCESAMAAMENRMIAYADRLREAREERLEQLRKFGPRAYIDRDGVKQLVLLRDGKEKYHDFTDLSVMVVYCDNEGDRKKYGLTEKPADEDGRTFFIRVSPEDYGFPEYSIRITREEGRTIKQRWRESREARESYEAREAREARGDTLYGSAEVGKIVSL